MMPPRRAIPWIALLAAFALFLAQTLLASHEIEHLASGGEETCELCLSGAGLGSPLASAPPVLGLRVAAAPIDHPPRRQTTPRPFFRANQARAPPAPVRL
jgi:hypothetical protein